MTDALKDIIAGWAEIVEEDPHQPVSWVRAKDPVAFDFSKSRVAPDTEVERYVKLERELTGKEWVEACFARESGYLRLDLAREAGVECVSI